MKKYLLFVFVLPVLVYGQDLSQEVNEYKPQAGEKTLELQFEPFGDNPLDINGIRLRWFKSEQKAIRLNVFLGLSNDSQITQQEDSDLNLKELKDKDFSFTAAIRPGMEKHFKGTSKLSPYFGWEGEVAYRTSSSKTESQNGNDVNYIKRNNDTGYIRLGINALAGFDFYVAKKLYLGAEFGFGASWTKLLSVKIKSDITGFQEPDPEKRGSSFDIGPNVNAQIRLGYAF